MADKEPTPAVVQDTSADRPDKDESADTVTGEVYAAEHDAVKRYFVLSLRPGEVEGAIQDVFTALFEALRAKGRIIRNPAAFFWGIATRVRADRQAKQARDDRETELQEELPAPEMEEVVDTREELTRALAGLTPIDQTILRERYGEGTSSADVAKTLGISPSAARQKAGRAIRSIRAAIAVVVKKAQ